MIKYGQKLLKIHIGQQLLVGLFLFARNSSQQVLFTKKVGKFKVFKCAKEGNTLKNMNFHSTFPRIKKSMKLNPWLQNFKVQPYFSLWKIISSINLKEEKIHFKVIFTHLSVSTNW